MKAVILTSSIFYLLGLKMAQNIETTDKVAPQSEAVQVKQEQVIESKELKQKETEKQSYIAPVNDNVSNEIDSGKISIIRQNTPHLMEKMD